MKATALNVWTLGKVANGRRSFPNRFEAPQRAGLSRCLKAGLVATLRLTDAGVAAVNADESVPFVSVEE